MHFLRVVFQIITAAAKVHVKGARGAVIAIAAIAVQCSVRRAVFITRFTYHSEFSVCYYQSIMYNNFYQ